MFFDNGYGLLRILVLAPLAYLALIVMLRASGKRSLSKMNAFDFVITIALGSTLSSTILTQTTSLAEGVLATGLLIGLQYLLTWFSVRSDKVRNLVTNEPSLLYHQGHFLSARMKHSRITQAEIEAAIREAGEGSLVNVAAIVLETDGSFSIITSMPPEQDAPLGMSDQTAA